MDTGAVTGKGQVVSWDEPFPEGRQNCGKPEELLDLVLVMEREFLMGQGVSGDVFGDAGMPVRKLLSFAQPFGRLFVLIDWE